MALYLNMDWWIELPYFSVRVFSVNYITFFFPRTCMNS